MRNFNHSQPTTHPHFKDQAPEAPHNATLSFLDGNATHFIQNFTGRLKTS
jgi:hypothetical protein